MVLRLLLVAVLLLGAAGHGFPQQPVLRIGTRIYPPLTKADHTGMLDTLLTEAFARIGVGVEFVALPSQRSLVEADTGAIDGDNNRVGGMEAAYPHLVRVPESTLTYEFMAFATRPDLVLRGWESLGEYSVGIIRGWKILEGKVHAKTRTTVATPEQLFALLKAGRVDLVLYDRISGAYYLKEMLGQTGYAVEPPLTRQEMFVYLNVRHAALAEPLAQALRDMKADGSYARHFAPGR